MPTYDYKCEKNHTRTYSMSMKEYETFHAPPCAECGGYLHRDFSEVRIGHNMNYGPEGRH